MADSSTAVIVSWTAPSMPNGIITQYEVRYTRNDVENAVTQRMNVSSGTATQLSDLERFANYTVSVVAFTIAMGEESEAVTVRTNEDGESIRTCGIFRLLPQTEISR